MRAGNPLRTGVALLALGCGAPQTSRVPPPRLDASARLAVLPFRPGMLEAGAVLVPAREPSDFSEEVGRDAARKLAAQVAALGIPVVDPEVVAGATSLADTSTYDARLAVRVGRRTGATLATLGAVTRYRQREGTAWAARTPASVEYQVALLRVADGAVLLFDRFAYTQQALSENILDLPRFLRGGGRWLTREEILDGALAETAEKLVRAIRGGAPPEGAGHTAPAR